jgi:formylmethanofuran dehydrogenase subunit E
VLTVAAAVACFGVQLRALAAEGDNAASDMAVTGLSSKNMCFTDTLQVTGVLVPKNEILVRPESAKDYKSHRCSSSPAILSLRGKP